MSQGSPLKQAKAPATRSEARGGRHSNTARIQRGAGSISSPTAQVFHAGSMLVASGPTAHSSSV